MLNNYYVNDVKKRVNFYLSEKQISKLEEVSSELNINNTSEIVRLAIDNFIQDFEKEKFNKIMEAGYKANADYSLRELNDWNDLSTENE